MKLSIGLFAFGVSLPLLAVCLLSIVGLLVCFFVVLYFAIRSGDSSDAVHAFRLCVLSMCLSGLLGFGFLATSVILGDESLREDA